MLDTEPTLAEVVVTQQPDITDLSSKQLRDLIDKARSLLDVRTEQVRAEARAKVQRIADELGINIYELIGARPPKSRGAAVSGSKSPARPKYRLPNGGLWSGKGKIPLAPRDHLKDAPEYNVIDGSFDSKEARTEALKKFLIDEAGS